MPMNWRIALLAVAVGLYVGGRGAWVWQASEYGKQLAEQASGYVQQLADSDRAHGREREEAAATALQQLAEQKSQRQALEDRLQEQGKTHWKEMSDAQQTQDRLRDRLATADLRLSVLVDAGAFATPGGDSGMREAAGTGGVVHGALRARLDPAHAQRIIGITDTGDRGLIALQACQAYVREVTK
ncbi:MULTISPECIES: lysis system i-spanin subunit Rz [unclassified Pseudomonas]|uniref:lysis system i-spanin subunit Rz n=1 Tax=unclassified Pseudomonas TaxID=196821 RepID=UPI000A0D7ECF|nr:MULTISPECIES: lysis system i-spanin subunit Rz [unclassified Pseudomonas]SMF59265.1 Bacteriophage Rz lysis protein [Pseudomonas sp. LAIL14HWK12:I11]SMR80016.1 Bacteriophage Rz lysis protein [Pseudomonas sp. LAIL14HWK12:I10]SOD07754.1 Bacteriophage Rz lysis protein [Pseudomonas sp. LAIL14HWK12:I8]